MLQKMNNLNTLPIEMFLEKAKIARKSGQKSLSLPINDVIQLEESLSVVLARLAGELDAILLDLKKQTNVTITMDGGSL